MRTDHEISFFHVGYALSVKIQALYAHVLDAMLLVKPRKN
jgi:hypothetical protein